MGICSVTFELEVLTPMFMYGADQKEAESRPSAIKGMIRYWWRILQPDTDINELHRREQKIFGGVWFGKVRNKIARPTASPLTIRVTQQRFLTGKYPFVPGAKGGKGKPHPTIWPTTRFDLNLQIDGLSSEEVKKIEAVVRLTFLLGSFGRRARRGFGSVQERNFTPETADEVAQHVHELLGALGLHTQVQGRVVRVLDTDSKRYNRPVLLRVTVCSQYDAWQKLVGKVREASHDFNINGCLGTANPRFASPVWVSVVRLSNGSFVPVVSELAFASKGGSPRRNLSLQSQFVKAICGQ